LIGQCGLILGDLLEYTKSSAYTGEPYVEVRKLIVIGSARDLFGA
jgi:hypothetical protein